MNVIRDAHGSALIVQHALYADSPAVQVTAHDTEDQSVILCLSIIQAMQTMVALRDAIEAAVTRAAVAQASEGCWHTFLPKRGPYEPVAPPCMTDTEAASAATEALDRIVAGFGR